MHNRGPLVGLGPSRGGGGACYECPSRALGTSPLLRRPFMPAPFSSAMQRPPAWRSPTHSDDDYYSAGSSASDDTLHRTSAISFHTRLAEASIDDFFRGSPTSSPEVYDMDSFSQSPRTAFPRADSGLDLSLDQERPSPDLARADMQAMADAALNMIAQLKRLLAQDPEPEPTPTLPSISEEPVYEEIQYEEVRPQLPSRPPPLPLRNPPTTLPKLKPFSRSTGRFSLPLSASLPKFLRSRFTSSRKKKIPSKHVFSPPQGPRPALSEMNLHQLKLSPTRTFGGSALHLNQVNRIWDSPEPDPLCGRDRLRSLAPRLSARSLESLRHPSLSPFATQV